VAGITTGQIGNRYDNDHNYDDQSLRTALPPLLLLPNP
jgi:hypothetical protein